MNGLYEILNDENHKNINNRIERIIFEIIFKHINDMVYIMKAEPGPLFTYVFANEAAYAHAKLAPNYIGKTLQEVLLPSLAEAIQEEYGIVYDTKAMRVFSDEVILPEGIKRYGESVLTPILDTDGYVKFIVSVTRDVTKLQEEKQRLIEREQQIRSIVDHNLDAVLGIDLHGSIYTVNPAGEKLTGYTLEKILNRSIFELIDEDSLTYFKDQIRKCRLTHLSQSIDSLLKMKNGHVLNLHIKIIPILVNNSAQGMYIILRDMSEKKETAEKIRYMAFHDQLTGLYNRRALLEDLNMEIKKAKENGTEIALLTIDLDRFKYINDTFGHIVGDQILIKVADRLLEFNNVDCHVYRQGGDEFIIILANITRQKATSFAQAILSRFASSFYLDSQEYYITPSIGISMYPNDGKDEGTLIKNADEALFRVKERGKAHYQFYRSDMNITLTNIVTMETNLRKAVQNEELTLFYQPQIDLKDKTIKSVEALLRWECPTLGFVSPGEFIPLAEDTGLIIPIGNWVIETACKQISSWLKAFGNGIRIAVNISPKQFEQPNFVDIIKSAIIKNDIPANLLEIEITEGAMHNSKEAIPVLRKLKELGVIISVDDFGTGYSSLSYIKQFPIDILKIDQSFVRDVLENVKDAAIITTIIHLGKNLGMDVIAEGVECQEQADILLAANCHKAQGFYYSRPLPASEVEKLLLSRANFGNRNEKADN
ncbi:EAL domain-containing protein [Niallia taxi]|uniref:putative bifunctional diguanylate cyclase/phosphodiesterase n=1 Tax=Niallia taxi TaxID=2499688 RepID=UPI0021A415B3|nr:GGDEF and EAL domain-containing protein [Niallia taxi]MCT2344128.1 EAL domain-containing protein [Niallia taxi]MDE5051335.1 EAL domain-containing protein [Niallia taxi]